MPGEFTTQVLWRAFFQKPQLARPTKQTTVNSLTPHIIWLGPGALFTRALPTAITRNKKLTLPPCLPPSLRTPLPPTLPSLRVGLVVPREPGETLVCRTRITHHGLTTRLTLALPGQTTTGPPALLAHHAHRHRPLRTRAAISHTFNSGLTPCSRSQKRKCCAS